MSSCGVVSAVASRRDAGDGVSDDIEYLRPADNLRGTMHFRSSLPCPICGRQVTTADELLRLGFLVADVVDPLFYLNESTVHAACVESHGLREEIVRASVGAKVQARPCVVCMDDVSTTGPDLTLGYLTSQKASPLYRYSFLAIHNQHYDAWPDRPDFEKVMQAWFDDPRYRGSRLVFATGQPPRWSRSASKANTIGDWRKPS
jgi:hypothetical protein